MHIANNRYYGIASISRNATTFNNEGTCLYISILSLLTAEPRGITPNMEFNKGIKGNLPVFILTDYLSKSTTIDFQGQEITQIPVMLVGNKCDESAELREVTNSEGQAEAASWGVSFMETSAKTNHNVTELFQVT